MIFTSYMFSSLTIAIENSAFRVCKGVWNRMERTEIMGKDVILHKEMSQQEREKELERLKAESDNLKKWEE